MNGLLYVLIFALLFFAELFYFHIADKFNIIDKPNERSSHASIVLRGGGVIFLLGLWTWAFFFGFSAAVVSYGRYLNWGRKFYR